MKILERSGNDPKELRSELLQIFWEVEKGYRWADENRLARWRVNASEVLAEYPGHSRTRGCGENSRDAGPIRSSA